VPSRSQLILRAKGRAIERAIARELGLERQLALPGVTPATGAPRRRPPLERAGRESAPARQQLALRNLAISACRECGRRNYHLRSCSQRR
jgi:hypothetical protein